MPFELIEVEWSPQSAPQMYDINITRSITNMVIGGAASDDFPFKTTDCYYFRPAGMVHTQDRFRWTHAYQGAPPTFGKAKPSAALVAKRESMRQWTPGKDWPCVTAPVPIVAPVWPGAPCSVPSTSLQCPSEDSASLPEQDVIQQLWLLTCGKTSSPRTHHHDLRALFFFKFFVQSCNDLTHYVGQAWLSSPT